MLCNFMELLSSPGMWDPLGIIHVIYKRIDISITDGVGITNDPVHTLSDATATPMERNVRISNLVIILICVKCIIVIFINM